jgi:hypothetical protein
MTATTTLETTATTSRSGQHGWAAYAAITAGGALLLKSLLIIGSGDSVPTAPMAVLYLTGIALALAAAVGTGLRQRRGRRAVVGFALFAFVALWIVMLGDALTPIFELFSDEAYVGDEGPVGVLGIALLAFGSVLGRRDRMTDRVTDRMTGAK